MWLHRLPCVLLAPHHIFVVAAMATMRWADMIDDFTDIVVVIKSIETFQTISTSINTASFVHDLKSFIFATWGDDINEQRMIFGTTILTNDRTIDSYNIRDGDVIHLCVPPGLTPSVRVCRSVARAAGV